MNQPWGHTELKNNDDNNSRMKSLFPGSISLGFAEAFLGQLKGIFFHVREMLGVEEASRLVRPWRFPSASHALTISLAVGEW